MAWKKQENSWKHQLCPADAMSFTQAGISIGVAARGKLCVSKYKSVDILLDTDTEPAKLGIQFHGNGAGEFVIGASGKAAFISCGAIMRRLREMGYARGRYHFRTDQPELVVFDLNLRTGELRKARGGK